MRFPDYINILKNHFKQTISIEELCHILFDSIILPANLTDSHNEPLYIDKSEISRIMNYKKNIPSLLQEHIHDDEVLSTMNDYFQKNIVSELAPDTPDLLHQMLQDLATDNHISPSHMATLHLQATDATLALFLADIFIYVMRRENKQTHSVRKITPSISNSLSVNKPLEVPEINLCGITLSNAISDFAEITTFHVRTEYTTKELLSKITDCFNEAMSIHCYRKTTLTAQARIQQLGTPIYLQYTMRFKEISEYHQKLISKFAKEINIKLPEDFFNLGNLRKKSTDIFGNDTYHGTDMEKKKIELLESLLDYIHQYNKLKPVDNALSNFLFLRLAVSNTGTSIAEDIRIQLKIHAISLVDAEDIAEIDTNILRSIFDDYSCKTLFDIKRTATYFDHPLSTAIPSIHDRISNITCGSKKRDFAQDWRNYFPYYLEQQGDYTILELTIDEIMHHSTVAFPTVLLLKKPIESIEYTLFCRQLPNIKEGTLKVAQV